MTVLVNVIVTVGMLYVVPAGLRLIDPAGLRRTARLWPLPAAVGAVSLWLPRGLPATVLAALYAAACLALAARAPSALLRGRVPGPALLGGPVPGRPTSPSPPRWPRPPSPGPPWSPSGPATGSSASTSTSWRSPCPTSTSPDSRLPW